MKKTASIYWMSRKEYWWCEALNAWVTGIVKHPISSIRPFKDKRSLLKEWKIYPDAVCNEWRTDKDGNRNMHEMEKK